MMTESIYFPKKQHWKSLAFTALSAVDAYAVGMF